MARPIYLIDQKSAQVAVLDVHDCNGHFEGTISLDPAPPALRQMFEQFEEVVEGQMFTLLDDIEAKIAALPLRVVLEDGKVACVADLQVFPSRKAVSLR